MLEYSIVKEKKGWRWSIIRKLHHVYTPILEESTATKAQAFRNVRSWMRKL